MIWISAYLFIINAIGLLIMRKDKRKAIRNQYRIPEYVLLLIALLGGSIGSYAGMKLFRHKTRKPLFSLGLPLIISLQIILAVIIICITR